jgi:protein CpxP
MTIKLTCYSAVMAAGVLLPVLALPAGAFAQAQPPVAGAPAMPKAKPAKPGAASPTERVEEHISRLHAQLRITPAEEPQWNQFAQVMRENAKDMEQVLQERANGFAGMNAADNLQSYAHVAQRHAQDTEKLATAFQALYGSLSDEQKKNADAVFRARGERGGHKRG